MEIIVGKYKNTKIGLIDGTRKISILNFPWIFDHDSVQKIINQTGLNNSGKGCILAEPGWFKGTINYAKIDTAPVATLKAVAGNITAGSHVYVCTFVTAEGEESIAGPASNSVTTILATNGQVDITCSAGPSGTVARNIYRSLAGTSTPLYYVGQIADNNPATVFTDNLADSSISTLGNPPTISNNYDFDYSVAQLNGQLPFAVNINDKITVKVDIPDDVKDINQGVVLVQEQSPSELPPPDPEPSVISDSNIAIGIYYYEIPVSSYRNFLAQLKATCGTLSSIIKIFATLDPNAVVPATNGTPSVDWIDLTKILYGSNYIYIPIVGTAIFPVINWNIDRNGKSAMYERFLIQYNVKNAVNTINLNIRKF